MAVFGTYITGHERVGISQDLLRFASTNRTHSTCFLFAVTRVRAQLGLARELFIVEIRRDAWVLFQIDCVHRGSQWLHRTEEPQNACQAMWSKDKAHIF
jgi:hypothetical protein